VTHTAVATIIRFQGYNPVAMVSVYKRHHNWGLKCTHGYNYGVPMVTTELHLCVASGFVLLQTKDNLSFHIVPPDDRLSLVTIELGLCVTLDIGLASVFIMFQWRSACMSWWSVL
jgi:hypothetical protein